LAAATFVGSLGTSLSAHGERQIPNNREQLQLSYAPLVKKAAPAVVNVYAQRVVQTRSRSPFADDPFFAPFFNRRGLGAPRERVQNSLGSGVIVREDGIIVTNNHVIQGGDEFKIVLADRREFEAEVVLQDERTDLAILRIDTDGEKLPVLPFHDSDDAEVGDLVLAIGNPFGVGQTVTGGIISALARTQVGVSDFQFFIQTDAAVNPGNSGGALITMGGSLIGVNTAIFSRSGGSNGIGFAIPANMVRLVVDSALSDGKIKRPWFGASGQVVTHDLATSLGMDRPTGILVNQLHDSGPADKAGIEIGDVVLAIDGYEVNDVQALRYRIATQKIGDKVKVSYLRDGREKLATLKLRQPPEDPPANETELGGRHPLTGATVANLSPAFNDENGLDTMLRGVVVKSLVTRSWSGRLGLQPGDIIVAVNEEEIRDVSQLQDVMSGSPRVWELVFRRGSREMRVNVRG
jgi:Do/DeqQ family serine protease